MKPGDRAQIPTVSEAVRDAAAICDPEGTDTVVTALFEGFEDDERPATAAEDLAGELLETVERIDPDADSPAARVTVACAAWIAGNPGDGDATRVMQEGARLVFGDSPPPGVAEWLAGAGVEL